MLKENKGKIGDVEFYVRLRTTLASSFVYSIQPGRVPYLRVEPSGWSQSACPGRVEPSMLRQASSRVVVRRRCS